MPALFSSHRFLCLLLLVGFPAALHAADPFAVESSNVIFDRPDFAPVNDSPEVVTAHEFQQPGAAEPIEQTSGMTTLHLFEEKSFPTVRVTGFLQADSVWVVQDAASRSHPAIGDVQDGADFRRTRLATVGNVAENVSYMIEMDFAFPGRPSFMDVFLDLHDLPVVGNFRVGQWRQPFGMDGLTSVRELTFIERSLPFAFVPFRQIGAGVYDTYADDDGTWGVSVFRFPTDPFGGNIGDRGYSMAGRVTRMLWSNADESELIHVGASFSLLNPASHFVRYFNQPEAFAGEVPGNPGLLGAPHNLPPFVDTGVMTARSVQVYGLETAAVFQSLYMQGEFLWSHVDRIGDPSVTFQGAYASVAYLLTGEVRPYNHSSGALGRVKPLENFNPTCGGYGAWEVAARWSWIDLNEGNIDGGEMHDLTLGLNWYLNQYTKFQFNYIHSHLNRAPVSDANANLFAVRAQLDF